MRFLTVFLRCLVAQVMALLPTNEQMLQSIAKRPRTSLSTPSAALYYSRNDAFGDGVSRPSSSGHSDRSSSPTVQHLQQQHQQQQQQQQRQRQQNAVCPIDTDATAARAGYPPYRFASRQTYTDDGALNLVREPPPPQRDEPSSSSGSGEDDNTAAGTSPPVIWRAFAAAAAAATIGPRQSVATAACCQLYGAGDDDERRLPRGEDASGAQGEWFRRLRVADSRRWETAGSSGGGDDDGDDGRGDPGLQSWGAVGRPTAVGPPPTSWLMMQAAATAAATCAGCALDATASGPKAA